MLWELCQRIPDLAGKHPANFLRPWHRLTGILGHLHLRWTDAALPRHLRHARSRIGELTHEGHVRYSAFSTLRDHRDPYCLRSSRRDLDSKELVAAELLRRLFALLEVDSPARAEPEPRRVSPETEAVRSANCRQWEFGRTSAVARRRENSP